MSILTREFIKAETGFKLKFSSYEELYPLFDLLAAHLPTRTPAKAEETVAEKPKVKKAKKVSPAEAELLAPADAGAGCGDLPTLGATDAFRSNKYRLSALDTALCAGRRYDEKNPVVGTRTEDDGANGIIFPELQCTKKPVPGCRLCSVCTKNEAEYKADTSKAPKRWYGRLDEPMYAKARIVGSEWFLSKYPAGIAEAPVSEPIKVKKAKKAPEPAAAESAEPVKVKKAKKAPEPAAAEPESAAEAEPAAESAATEPEPTAEPIKAKKPKKVSVAADGAAKDVEWVTFLSDGIPLVRHTKTGNVYQCDRTKHRLEDMVQRDKYEGKWRDGRLDPYADEEDE